VVVGSSGIFLLRHRAAFALLVPVVTVAAWFATAMAGEALLGWTA
jgi:hypothetical protein